MNIYQTFFLHRRGYSPRIVKKLMVGVCLIFCIIIVAAFLIFGPYGFVGKYRPRRCEKCNIVFIDVDVLRADDLPCYGYSQNTMPNVCSFAKNGYFFVNNYAQSYWTFPSSISTLTSLYPTVHGVREVYKDSLAPSVPTLATILNNYSYRTYFIGFTDEMLSEQTGMLRGYENVTHDIDVEHWITLLKSAKSTKEPFFLHVYNAVAHMPYLFENESLLSDKMEKPKGFPITRLQFNLVLQNYLIKHYAEVFTPETIRTNPNIFLQVDKHGAEVLSLFESSDLQPAETRITRLQRSWGTIYGAYLERIDPHNSQHLRFLRTLYDASISLYDRDLGKLFDALSLPEFSKDTIVVLSSSHGEAFGEHSVLGHDLSPYNELLHTPLVIKIPGGIQTSIQTVSQNIDIVPTLLDLIRIPKPLHLQGASLVPLFSSEKKAGQRYAISMPGPLYTIQDGQWKLIVDDIEKPNKNELYNMMSDPGEHNNLATESADLVKRYQRLLMDRLKEAQQKVDTNLPSVISPSKRKELIKEGYF